MYLTNMLGQTNLLVLLNLYLKNIKVNNAQHKVIEKQLFERFNRALLHTMTLPMTSILMLTRIFVIAFAFSSAIKLLGDPVSVSQ